MLGIVSSQFYFASVVERSTVLGCATVARNFSNEDFLASVTLCTVNIVCIQSQKRGRYFCEDGSCLQWETAVRYFDGFLIKGSQ